MIRCPACNKRVSLKATVDTWLQDSEWNFWGKKGNRWILCKDARYVHFRVNNKGISEHRLAMLRGGS